jgi:pyruvate dehydrogenase E1 component beta subunit
MQNYDDLAILGLGVSYPDGADGTMGNLGQEYPHRVLDTPASESTITGVAIGAAISGKRTIVHHGRVEFALFAADQIVTQAANWNYMFGGKSPVPVTFRIAIGRQWGNGPQHTASHISLFSATPGLKVVCPSSPRSAFELLQWSVADKNPVVFLEPRWLYKLEEDIDMSLDGTEGAGPEVIREGLDVSVISFGEGVLESVLASNLLADLGISCEVIDLKVLSPLDLDIVAQSVKKTGRLLVVDPYSRNSGIGDHVVSYIAQIDSNLKSAPVLLAPPFTPVPTAPSLSAEYYKTVRSQNITTHIARMFELSYQEKTETFEDLHLPPTTKIGKNWEILQLR